MGHLARLRLSAGIVVALTAMLLAIGWLVFQGPARAAQVSFTVEVVDSDTGPVGSWIEVLTPSDDPGGFDHVPDAYGGMEDGIRTVVLPEPGDYRLLVQPDPGSGLVDFHLDVQIDASPVDLTVVTPPARVGWARDQRDGVDLTVTAPAPNLEVVVVEPGLDGGPVSGVGASLRRTVTREGGSLTYDYRWGVAETDGDGALRMFVQDDGSYSLRVARGHPTWAETRLGFQWSDGVFTTLGGSPLLDADGRVELSLVEPNLIVEVLEAADGPPASAWISVQRWVDHDGPGGFDGGHGGYWDWLDLETSTDGAGRAALYLVEGRYRLDIQSDGAGLPTFDVEVAVTEDGEVRTADGIPLGEDRTLTVSFPTPNLTVRLLADGAPVPDASMWVSRENQDLGFWEWAGGGAWTDEHGVAVLSIGDAGRYRLEIQPPYGTELVRFTFPFEIGGDGEVVHDGQLDEFGRIELVFPEPNLTFRLEDAGGAAVAGAFVEVQREVSEADWSFWESTGAYTESGPDGQVRLLVPDDGAYRLWITPPHGRGDLAWFARSFDVDAGVANLGAGVLAFPVPNVTGVVADVDGPVGQAWIQVARWVLWDEHGDDGQGDDGYWDWMNLVASTTSDGGFALYLPDDGRYRIEVQPPWNVQGLINFNVEVEIDDGHAALLEGQADVAVVLDGAFHLTFPTPNISGTLRAPDPGFGLVPVRDASISVEQWVTETYGDGDDAFTETYWRWTENYAFTNADGDFWLRITEPGTFRLRIQAPWGSSLPSFLEEFVIADGQAGQPLELLPVFPTANVAFGVAAQGTPVRDAWVNVLQWEDAGDYWRWAGLGSGTDRNGEAAFHLEEGRYRLSIWPPYRSADLVPFQVELTIDAAGTVTFVPPIDGDIDGRPVFEFPTPNVEGQVLLERGSGSEPAVPSSWSWMWVGSTTDPGFSLGASTRRDGRFVLSLPDGGYELTIYPGNTRSSFAPLEVVATVTEGTFTAWASAGGAGCDGGTSVEPCFLDVSFADVVANLVGTVVDGGTEIVGAFVTVTREGFSRTVVTDGQGRFSLAVPEPDQPHELTILVDVGSGEPTCRVTSVTPSSAPPEGLSIDLASDGPGLGACLTG